MKAELIIPLDEESLTEALQVLSDLMDLPDEGRSIEEIAILQAQALLIEDYEDKHWPISPLPWWRILWYNIATRLPLLNRFV